jgi:hypothetical protein
MIGPKIITEGYFEDVRTQDADTTLGHKSKETEGDCAVKSSMVCTAYQIGAFYW